MSRFKKVLKVILKVSIYLVTILLFIVVNLFLAFKIFCYGPSTSAKDLFVTTFLETGKLKFIVSLVLPKGEISRIVNQNSLKSMNSDVDENLIGTTNDNDNQIITENISGDTYEATMMIIKNPAKVFVGTTYPWSEYGSELSSLVEDNGAIVGVNGGLYVDQDYNRGGHPGGVVVSNGVIENLTNGMYGLVLVGLDNNNILKMISLSGRSTDEIKDIILNEGIRDAVCFQEESSNSNNHFTKLIVNGTPREINGYGSGANPRTVIGQKKDGTILLLVTDGRGTKGHIGATASDLIEIMQKYDAVNAANLDGGSSSAMYYKGKYLRTSVTLYHANNSWRLPTSILVKE
jgi:exopolysaccharide biosynthesis protein